MALGIEEDTMKFNRKTQKELAKLNKEAHRLWEEQRDVLAHAREVAKDATRVAGSYTKREVFPKAAESYHAALAPVFARLSQATAKPKKSANPLKFVLMAVGAIAVAALSYAAWQTLRADDDLWVEEDSD
jgi:glutamate-1-semialdehyde aminotransferase